MSRHSGMAADVGGGRVGKRAPGLSSAVGWFVLGFVSSRLDVLSCRFFDGVSSDSEYFVSCCSPPLVALFFLSSLWGCSVSGIVTPVELTVCIQRDWSTSLVAIGVGPLVPSAVSSRYEVPRSTPWSRVVCQIFEV